MQVLCLSAGRGTLQTAWLRFVMEASFSLPLDRAHLIHHGKPIGVRCWEKCGASGTNSTPISENEKTNNRTWLGVIGIVFTDSLLLEQDTVCSRDQMWFKDLQSSYCYRDAFLQILVLFRIQSQISLCHAHMYLYLNVCLCVSDRRMLF